MILTGSLDGVVRVSSHLLFTKYILLAIKSAAVLAGTVHGGLAGTARVQRVVPLRQECSCVFVFGQ